MTKVVHTILQTSKVYRGVKYASFLESRRFHARKFGICGE